MEGESHQIWQLSAFCPAASCLKRTCNSSPRLQTQARSSSQCSNLFWTAHAVCFFFGAKSSCLPISPIEQHRKPWWLPNPWEAPWQCHGTLLSGKPAGSFEILSPQAGSASSINLSVAGCCAMRDPDYSDAPWSALAKKTFRLTAKEGCTG